MWRSRTKAVPYLFIIITLLVYSNAFCQDQGEITLPEVGITTEDEGDISGKRIIITFKRGLKSIEDLAYEELGISK